MKGETIVVYDSKAEMKKDVRYQDALKEANESIERLGLALDLRNRHIKPELKVTLTEARNDDFDQLLIDCGVYKTSGPAEKYQFKN